MNAELIEKVLSATPIENGIRSRLNNLLENNVASEGYIQSATASVLAKLSADFLLLQLTGEEVQDIHIITKAIVSAVANEVRIPLRRDSVYGMGKIFQANSTPRDLLPPPNVRGDDEKRFFFAGYDGEPIPDIFAEVKP